MDSRLNDGLSFFAGPHVEDSSQQDGALSTLSSSTLTLDTGALYQIFARYDPGNTGKISTRDFLNIIDEFDELQGKNAPPLMTEEMRLEAYAVVEPPFEMTRDELLEFVRQVIGQDLFSASNITREKRQQKLLDPICSPLTSARPRSTALSNKLGRVVKGHKATLFDSSDGMIAAPVRRIAHSGSKGLQAKPSERPCVPQSSGRRKATPIAHSTPNKNSDVSMLMSLDTPIALDRRSASSFRANHAQRQCNRSDESEYNALGEGAFSPSASSSLLSPNLERSANQSAEGGQERMRLLDTINMLEERDRQVQATVEANERQIQYLEDCLQKSDVQLTERKRDLSEARQEAKIQRESASDLYSSMERDYEDLQNELRDTHERLLLTKLNLDNQTKEMGALQYLIGNKESEIECLGNRFSDAEIFRKTSENEKLQTTNKLWQYEAELTRLREVETNLFEARAANDKWEEHVQRLQIDMEAIKKDTTNNYHDNLDHDIHTSGHPQTLESELSSAPEETWLFTDQGKQKLRSTSGIDNTQINGTASLKDTGTQVIPQMSDKCTQANLGSEPQIPKLGFSYSAEEAFRQIEEQEILDGNGKEERLKAQYEVLANELGLQRNLIDKLLKMKSGRKQVIGTKPPSQHLNFSPLLPNAKQVASPSTIYLPQASQCRLLLIGLLFLTTLIGVWILFGESHVHAPGNVYVDWTHDDANRLDDLVNNWSRSGTIGVYRWWEGGLKWVECIGYWAELKLSDGMNWPT